MDKLLSDFSEYIHSPKIRKIYNSYAADVVLLRSFENPCGMSPEYFALN